MLAPLRDLFAAVFFVFFGLQTNPSDIPPVLGAALLLALASAAGKACTGWWAAKRSGVSIPGRVRAGATLIAHGEFSIVIAGLAVDSGQPERLGALAAAYVLLLAALGPVAARFADPVGRRWAARSRRRSARRDPVPAPPGSAGLPVNHSGAGPPSSAACTSVLTRICERSREHVSVPRSTHSH
jgi:CPA2 family monovalent cation:H+ antiporter-2